MKIPYSRGRYTHIEYAAGAILASANCAFEESPEIAANLGETQHSIQRNGGGAVPPCDAAPVADLGDRGDARHQEIVRRAAGAEPVLRRGEIAREYVVVDRGLAR